MLVKWLRSCVSSAAWGWQPCIKEFSIMTVTGCGLQGAARMWASGALRAWRSCRSPALTMSTLMPSHLMEVRMHSFCFKSFPVSKLTTLSVCGSKISLSSSARNLGLCITGGMRVELRIKNVCWWACFELCHFSSLRHLFLLMSPKHLCELSSWCRLDPACFSYLADTC